MPLRPKGEVAAMSTELTGNINEEQTFGSLTRTMYGDSRRTKVDLISIKRTNEQKRMRNLALTGVMLFVACTLAGVVIHGEVASDVLDNVEMNMAGGFATFRARPAKGKGKGKSNGPTKEDSPIEGTEAPAVDGSAKSSTSSKRPKRTQFRSGHGSGTTPQPLGVALGSQMPVTGYLGLDACYLPGFIGNLNADKSTDTSKSFLSLGTGGKLTINPRAYQVVRSDVGVQAQDLERLSAYSPGSLFGRAIRYLKQNTSIWSEMNPRLQNEGYLNHWMQNSYQAGMWFKRALLGMYIEQEAMKGRAMGKAGTTSDHDRVPYAKLYEEIKPLYTREAAGLDLTKEDYTISEWFEGFLTRFNPVSIGTVRTGMTRPRFVVHDKMFEVGYNSEFSGYTADPDGNPTLVVPVMDIPDSGTAYMAQVLQEAEGDVLSITSPGVGDEELSVDSSKLPIFGAIQTGISWNSSNVDIEMPLHTERYNEIRTSPKVIPTDTQVAQYLDSEHSNYDDSFDWVLTPSHVLANIGSIKTIDTLVGLLWTKGGFVGGHNIEAKAKSATPWNVQQTLLNATPDELIEELSYWNRVYPQEVQEYQDHLGFVTDFAPFVAATGKEWDFWTAELNLHSKYTVKFNPRNDGEWHRGPGSDTQISELYYEKDELTPTQLSDLMSIRYPQMQIFSADKDRSLSSSGNDGIFKFADTNTVSSLMPTTKSMARKGERSLVLPAGQTKEAVPYNGSTPVGGSGLIGRVIASMSHKDLDFSERYPFTDLDFSRPRLSSMGNRPIILDPVIEGGGNVGQSKFKTDNTVMRFAESALGHMTGAVDITLDEQHDDWPIREEKHLSRSLSKSKANAGVIEAWLPPMPVASRWHETTLVSSQTPGSLMPHFLTDGIAVTPLSDGTVVLSNEGAVMVSGATNHLSAIAPASSIGARTENLQLEPINDSPLPAGLFADPAQTPDGEFLTLLGDYGGVYNQYGLTSLSSVAIWTDVWTSQTGEGSTPIAVPPLGLEYAVRSTGSGNFGGAYDQLARLNYFKLTVEEGKSGRTYEIQTPNPALLARLEDLHKTQGSWGGCYFDAEYGMLEQLADHYMNLSEVDVVYGFGGQTVRTRHFDVFSIELENGGTLTAAEGEASIQLKMPSQAVTFNTTLEVRSILDSQALAPLDLFRLVTLKHAGQQADVAWTGTQYTQTAGSLVQNYSMATLGGGNPVFRPYRIIPNNVKAFFHPELEQVDAAVLYHSTDPRMRFAWAEGQLSQPFHGDMKGFRYNTLANMNHLAGNELAAAETNPLCQRGNLSVLRVGVCTMSGILEGRHIEEQTVNDMLSNILGYHKLTREIIYDVEEARRY